MTNFRLTADLPSPDVGPFHTLQAFWHFPGNAAQPLQEFDFYNQQTTKVLVMALFA